MGKRDGPRVLRLGEKPSPRSVGRRGTGRQDGGGGACESAPRAAPHPVRSSGPPSPRVAGRGQQAFVFLIQVFIPVSYQ
jgi:hypothetical protein